MDDITNKTHGQHSIGVPLCTLLQSPMTVNALITSLHIQRVCFISQFDKKMILIIEK